MYGLLKQSSNARWRIKISRIELCGIVLSVAEIPKGKLRRRGKILRRAARRMYRQGVRRVLLSPDEEWWPILAREGLKPVDTSELCKAVAAPLAIDILKVRGWNPEKAVVVLSERRAGRYLIRAADILAKEVRSLVFDIPDGGESLAEWLHTEYGIPIVPPGILRPSLTVAFDKPEREEGVTLRLFEERPDLMGAEIWGEGVKLPDGIDPISMLAAMLECGVLSERVLRVRRKCEADSVE